MKKNNRYDKEIREDLTQALRLIDKWSYDTSQNSIVFDNLFCISASLKLALESIGYTQKEVDEKIELEEQKKEELKQQEHENEIYELKEYIDEIIKEISQNEIKHLNNSDLKNIAYAIEISLRNKELPEEIVQSILTLLKFSNKCL